MKDSRRLALKREALSELSTEQLTVVVGGDALPTTPVRYCFEELFDTLQATRCFCP